MANQIDSRLVDGTTKPIFATQDHANSTYVRSTTCWAKDIDLTCASPWNSEGGNLLAGTLISPRHIVFANHYQLSVGTTIRFVAMNGTVVNRTMTAKQAVDDDIMVGLLDSDVPAGISFAKVLPDDAETKLRAGSPVLAFDQEEKALVIDFSWVANGVLWGDRPVTNQTRATYAESLISGDSGNPGFVIINGEAVLVTTWTYGGPGAGPAMHGHISGINAAMTALGGGYQLTTIDLSGF